MRAWESPFLKKIHMDAGNLCRLLWLLLLVVSGPSLADERDRRHGAVLDGITGFHVESAATLTFQHATRAPDRNEASISFDLVQTLPMGRGLWTLYVEGSTTPRAAGVTATFPAANADVGTTPDHRGRGRLQVSELHYGMETSDWQIVTGLIDVTAHLDLSEVANNETTQFLATPLVNNPTIAFPDYVPGLAWHRHARKHKPGIALVLAGSHGLADNAGHYARTFHLNAHGKGFFLAAELYGRRQTNVWRTGLWMRTDALVRRDGSGNGHARGIYGVFDAMPGEHLRSNLRLGITLDDVSKARDFASAAILRESGALALGAGLALTRLHGSKDERLVEIFARYRVNKALQLGPHIQWVGQPESQGPDGWITGLRVRLTL
ncbi:MAG: hypothetical protein D6721_01465 [Gammaproteobacteria bacterium]|nr:MAG: hypothetical protein D6721_01465 [Gammaproteobacteria bacterium]